MFRPSLGHPQALKESGSTITYMFYRNAFWDPKCLQNVIEVQYEFVIYMCFKTHVYYKFID
jgi:hypothetical protein